MTTTEIVNAIRRGIRRPSPVDISDTTIESVVLRGAIVLGQVLKSGGPDFFAKRVSLSSNTHVFSWPSDCTKIFKVWNLGTTADSITGAADNGSGAIRLTVSNSYSDDDICIVHDVAGTTEANSTWKLENVTATTVDLVGSTFSNAYTSGGKIFQVPENSDEIKRIGLPDATGSDESKWYPRGRAIVIDDPNFTNDLMVDHEWRIDSIDDVPVEFHEGLVSFGVMELIELPDFNSPQYQSMKKNFDLAEAKWGLVNAQIENSFSSSDEPSFIRDEWKYETQYETSY